MRRFLQAIAAIGLVASTLPATAAWPADRPIELVVGFAPGGGTDLLARKLVTALEKRIGDDAHFVVVNKPGAAGEIANGFVAHAKPDGYTLAIVNVPGFLYVPMTKKAQYSVGDFRLIARIVDDPTILVAKADSPFNTLGDVVDALRRKPGSLTFGHNGQGTNGDLAIGAFSTAAGLQLNAIPFKGTSAQKIDLLGGHLDFAVIAASEVPEVHGTKTAAVKVITQFADKRSRALPQVPTATASRIAVTMSSERGMAAPRGVSDAIARRLQDAIEETLRDPAFLASAAADEPVLAYLSGPQWEKSLVGNAKLLRQVADKAPK